MKMYKIKVLTLVCLWAATSEGKFPNNPKPCAYGDSKCIRDIIDFLLAEKTNGYSSLNLISLNPLKVNEISIRQGKESPVNINLNFKNSEIIGIHNAKTLQVKGFGKDISQPHELLLALDAISLISDYTIKGKVLILPISGTGKSNITMENLKVKVTLHGEPLVKGGETYMKLKDVKLHFDPSRLYFDFTNLFNGDKTLGDNMNLFLNENWKDIFGEVRESISNAFASIFQSVIDNVFQKYPYDKLFASE